MEKYMFFYLKTGGGHISTAKSLAEKMKMEKKGNLEIILIDGLAESSPFIKTAIEDGYKNALNKAIWTYEFLYAMHKISFISKISAFIISFLIKPAIEKQILATKPNKIAIFHFFLIKPIAEILKKHRLDIPTLIVVTDPYTAHPIWFIQKDQNYVVFSDKLKEKCIARGINKNRLEVFPFILDNKFSNNLGELEKLEIRAKLGFADNSKIILIIGGAEGMPRGMKILKKIVSKNIDAEVAIVCGKNKTLFDKANRFKTLHNIEKLKIFGYVDFVRSLIGISDVVITKSGPSTLMEILMMGKIPVINNYIWEQEKGNMEYVCQRRMGILEKNTKRLPDVLHKLITDNDFYNSIYKNIKNTTFINGVGPVSEYILNFQK